MAISVDPSSTPYRIIIPQADLTLISAGPPALYELDTDAFWEELKAWEASEEGIVFGDAQRHNSEYTVGGITYAQSVEILNSTIIPGLVDEYEIFFSPDTQYSVRLANSNNNLFDLQNGILANTTTQVIPNNSAGLQIVTTGSGVTQQDKDDIENQIFTRVVENSLTFEQMYRLIAAAAAGNIEQQTDGSYVIKGIDGTTDRIEGDDAANNGRTISARDGT